MFDTRSASIRAAALACWLLSCFMTAAFLYPALSATTGQWYFGMAAAAVLGAGIQHILTIAETAIIRVKFRKDIMVYAIYGFSLVCLFFDAFLNYGGINFFMDQLPEQNIGQSDGMAQTTANIIGVVLTVIFSVMLSPASELLYWYADETDRMESGRPHTHTPAIAPQHNQRREPSKEVKTDARQRRDIAQQESHHAGRLVLPQAKPDTAIKMTQEEYDAMVTGGSAPKSKESK